MSCSSCWTRPATCWRGNARPRSRAATLTALGCTTNNERLPSISCADAAAAAAAAAASPHFLTALEESANAALGCVCKSALEASFSERAADSKPLAKLLSPVDKTFSRLFADFGGGRLGRATGLDTQLQSAALNALETPAVVAFCDAIFRSVGDESASSSA